jgi:multisubunit Na+/H+ antiporter MnhB subunit
MTRPIVEQLLLAGSLVLTPALACAQPEWVEEARNDAAGMALFIIAIALIAVVFGTLREKRKHDLIARFIDKGQEIPPSLLPPPPSTQRELRRGIWLTALGLGVGLVLYITTGNLRVAAWCLIPLFLGGASFFNAVLFYPKNDSRQ